jgi:CheY-like chemotaxis protein
MIHTVVLVEDEDELRETMRDALELNGYTVVVARDGRQALDELDRLEHVCLVVLDLLMPGMNGWDFLHALRERPAFADVPIIVHSSAPDRAPQGVTRVLRKPIAFAQLLSVVHEFCAA